MKIPRIPKKPPIQPGLQSETAKKENPQQKQVNPDLAKIADQRAKALSSSAAKLISAAPSDFSKLGMQTLLRTAQMAGQGLSAGKIMLAEMKDQKIAANQSKMGSAAEKHHAERTQAWVNVGISVAVAGAVAGAGVATGATQAALDGVANHLKAAQYDKATDAWKITVASTPGADVNSLIQHVLRQAYLENNMDLQFYADKVKAFNETKSDIRSHLNELDEYRAGLGNAAEEALQSAGEDAQLANVDLQNILQKQQQSLQMMSNIAKMLHDTAAAVIRKIGG